jgi:dTDP-4-amino-4,6-dideoxygalactose transaminase
MERTQKVPYLDLKSQQDELRSEIVEALVSTVDSASFILGPKLEAFEKSFASYCGCGFALGTSSGTAALHLALLALGVGAGDEVITVPNTFIATVEAILYTGAKPVLVDVRDDTYCIDVDAVERAITPNTKAIIPVHIFGQPCDMDALMQLAQEHGISVIEDACQAHGAEYKGRRAGSIGHAAAFSFYPSKNLGAMGDGGAVTTSKPEVAETVRSLRHHAQTEKNVHVDVGYNYRLDALQAAVLQVKLGHLDEWNAKRRELAGYYMERLKNTEYAFQKVPSDVLPGYHIFTIRHKKQKLVKESLGRAKIGWGEHIAPPIHLQPGYRFLGYKSGSFPVCEALYRELVSLPIYPQLRIQQMDYIIETLDRVMVSI